MTYLPPLPPTYQSVALHHARNVLLAFSSQHPPLYYDERQRAWREVPPAGIATITTQEQSR